jgi:hypothetical protein
MADKLIPKLVFALVVLSILLAAAMAYLAPDPPTNLQTRFMDTVLLVLGAAVATLLALLKSSKSRRGP